MMFVNQEKVYLVNYFKNSIENSCFPNKMKMQEFRMSAYSCIIKKEDVYGRKKYFT